MIGKLKDLLAGFRNRDEVPAQDESLDLAVAVLLVEMARADHKLEQSEEREIQSQLQKTFGLDAAQGAGLLAEARDMVENSHSLHEFTRAIHERMDYGQKQRVIEMLWHVALVDRNLDKYEDYLVAKLGELLYVSRGDVLRLKFRVQQQQFSDRDD